MTRSIKTRCMSSDTISRKWTKMTFRINIFQKIIFCEEMIVLHQLIQTQTHNFDPAGIFEHSRSYILQQAPGFETEPHKCYLWLYLSKL